MAKFSSCRNCPLANSPPPPLYPPKEAYAPSHAFLPSVPCLCQDKGVAAVVLKGLAVHKEELGAPLCPCRNYDDKQAEANHGYWNCPCVPMRERKECHCMLFLTPDNDFAGTEQTITVEEIEEYTKGMGM